MGRNETRYSPQHHKRTLWLFLCGAEDIKDELDRHTWKDVNGTRFEALYNDLVSFSTGSGFSVGERPAGTTAAYWYQLDAAADVAGYDFVPGGSDAS